MCTASFMDQLQQSNVVLPSGASRDFSGKLTPLSQRPTQVRSGEPRAGDVPLGEGIATQGKRTILDRRNQIRDAAEAAQ
jgi:hypothetical protein